MFLTGLVKARTLNLETCHTCTLTNKRRFVQVIFSTQSSADYCRKKSRRIHYYFREELFEKTVNKNEN